MSLRLYYHPLSSFCQKALIALYENGTPFEREFIDLFDAQSRAKLVALWPLAKFPVLRDESRDWTVPESSIIIEYLDQHYPGPARLIPADADLARQTRSRDRFYDLHVNVPMGKIVTDRLRPEGCNDSYGVEQAKAALQTAYDMVEQDMVSKTWAMGDSFSMADCAAAPALFYANLVIPFGPAHPRTAAYLGRLMERPSYARVFKEAQPYLANVPN
ncbi:MAG: glutathione S-transferase family protein [Sinimarinibacterium sp.]|jgi:glutathione S-transferase